jgi:hypothetical protein
MVATTLAICKGTNNNSAAQFQATQSYYSSNHFYQTLYYNTPPMAHYQACRRVNLYQVGTRTECFHNVAPVIITINKMRELALIGNFPKHITVVGIAGLGHRTYQIHRCMGMALRFSTHWWIPSGTRIRGVPVNDPVVLRNQGIN